LVFSYAFLEARKISSSHCWLGRFYSASVT